MKTGPIEIALAPRSTLTDGEEWEVSLQAAKARLAARIVRILDESGYSVRQAEVHTGISHIELSHIRQAKLRRFTLDRLMAILETLGDDVEVSVAVYPRAIPPL